MYFQERSPNLDAEGLKHWTKTTGIPRAVVQAQSLECASGGTRLLRLPQVLVVSGTKSIRQGYFQIFV